MRPSLLFLSCSAWLFMLLFATFELPFSICSNINERRIKKKISNADNSSVRFNATKSTFKDAAPNPEAFAIPSTSHDKRHEPTRAKQQNRDRKTPQSAEERRTNPVEILYKYALRRPFLIQLVGSETSVVPNYKLLGQAKAEHDSLELLGVPPSKPTRNLPLSASENALYDDIRGAIVSRRAVSDSVLSWEVQTSLSWRPAKNATGGYVDTEAASLGFWWTLDPVELFTESGVPINGKVFDDIDPLLSYDGLKVHIKKAPNNRSEYIIAGNFTVPFLSYTQALGSCTIQKLRDNSDITIRFKLMEGIFSVFVQKKSEDFSLSKLCFRSHLLDSKIYAAYPAFTARQKFTTQPDVINIKLMEVIAINQIQTAKKSSNDFFGQVGQMNSKDNKNGNQKKEEWRDLFESLASRKEEPVDIQIKNSADARDSLRGLHVPLNDFVESKIEKKLLKTKPLRYVNNIPKARYRRSNDDSHEVSAEPNHDKVQHQVTLEDMAHLLTPISEELQSLALALQSFSSEFRHSLMEIHSMLDSHDKRHQNHSKLVTRDEASADAVPMRSTTATDEHDAVGGPERAVPQTITLESNFWWWVFLFILVFQVGVNVSLVFFKRAQNQRKKFL